MAQASWKIFEGNQWGPTSRPYDLSPGLGI